TTPVTISDSGAFDLAYTLPAGKTGTHLIRLEYPEELTKAESLEDDWQAQEALRAHQPFELVYRIRTAGGEEKWVWERAQGICAEGDEVQMIEGFISDITEIKQKTERIAEQAALLDKAQDAIIVRDLEHRILYWNQSAERLYGWTAAEARKCSVTELLYRDLTQFHAAMETVLRTGEWVGEIDHLTKDGQGLIIEGHWTLVRDEQGKPKSILAINTNITQRKKIEQQFLRSQRMESIGTLAGGIAHDLNNVLTPIMISVQLLQDQVYDESARELLTVLETTTQRGADLVKQVLSFARGVEGRRVIVRPLQIVHEIERIIHDTFPKNIDVVSAEPRDLWTIHGDPTQLHQVLMNLCVNARDAMPDGGRLTIDLSNVVLDERCSNLSSEAKPGPYLLIKVADTGTGMSDAVMDKIFEPFFTTKEIGYGTGLGLSTTLAIVKSHGGFVNVSSEIGHGSAFNLYI
ncbi:MAG: PAS domain S-box protein, partial [Verrucomicrobiaceae bacterium]